MKRILILLSTLLLAGPLFAQENDNQMLFGRAPADSTLDEQTKEALLQKADSLDNAAIEMYFSNDYGKTIELGTEAMEIRKEVLGDHDPVYALSLNNLSYYYLELGNYEKALEKKYLSNNIYAENIKSNFSFLPAAERSIYWDSVKIFIENSIYYCIG